MDVYSLTASSSSAHDRDDRRVIGEELPSLSVRSPHAPFERPRLDSPRSCKSAHKCKVLHLEVGASPRASPNLAPIPCTGSAAYVIRETRSETYLLAAERRSGRGHFHLRTDGQRPRPSGLTREFHGGGGGRDGSFKFLPRRPPPHFSRLWNLSSTRDIPRGRDGRREGGRERR